MSTLTPSTSKEVMPTLCALKIEDRIASMLSEFDGFVPEHYDGYDRPYQPLSRRVDLFEKHIPFGDLVIHTQLMEESTSNIAYCKATLMLLTEDGFQPLFSRYGEGNAMTSRTDGAVADAETSATRRILIALGLSNDGGKDEIATLKDSAERDFITNYLNSHRKSLESLIKAYNTSASQNSERIGEIGKNDTVETLNIADIIKLKRFISGKGE